MDSQRYTEKPCHYWGEARGTDGSQGVEYDQGTMTDMSQKSYWGPR